MKIRFNKNAQYIGRERNNEFVFHYVCILPCIQISWQKRKLPILWNELYDIEDMIMKIPLGKLPHFVRKFFRWKREKATIPLPKEFFDLEDIEDTPPPKKKSAEVSKQ